MSPSSEASEILIVDDDPAAADLLSRRLSLRRFTVSVAEDGEAALTQIEQTQPDLILLDVSMPGRNGIEILTMLRERFSALELPIILHSAMDDKSTQRIAFNAGANDYIAKPADIDLLVDRISAQLQARGAYKVMRREQSRLQRRLDTRERLQRGADLNGAYANDMANALTEALQNNDLTLAYQPKYDIREGRINGVEALARWAPPHFPGVTPAQFIGLAEETFLIGPLTHWALGRAIEDHIALEKEGLAVPIAINLSPQLVCDADATERILAHIGDHPHRVCLELTESALLQDPEQALRNLDALAAARIRISIDDYGAGWSSLSYLQRLPVHEIKIDRSFIARLTRSHRDPLLVRSTIELAHALDLEVVAEGVEDAETLALLRAMGCNYAQGYYISRPVPFADLRAFLSDADAIAAFGQSPTALVLFAAALNG